MSTPPSGSPPVPPEQARGSSRPRSTTRSRKVQGWPGLSRVPEGGAPGEIRAEAAGAKRRRGGVLLPARGLWGSREAPAWAGALRRWWPQGQGRPRAAWGKRFWLGRSRADRGRRLAAHRPAACRGPGLVRVPRALPRPAQRRRRLPERHLDPPHRQRYRLEPGLLPALPCAALGVLSPV